MAKTLGRTKGASMGTLPVFMTAISTILGAILFLRFGYAVGHVGLFGTLLIILVGHLVTIPTALAVAEIATNQKVEGGGAYYMISRSFGFNVGASIGITLFLSQAVSVAFYIIAFAVAFEPITEIINTYIAFHIPEIPYFGRPELNNTWIGLFFMGLLTILMVTKGANIGVKALYVVVVVLFVSLLLFFMGDESSGHQTLLDFNQKITDGHDFFYMFTIIFPAFTGIAAGLGLSGDLKDPKTSIPKGTLWATIVGIIVYVAVAFKLYFSATTFELAYDEMIMQKIAIWGPIIPIGLGCAAISSALGSVIIAPRTLQALGVDKIFNDGASGWFARGRKKDGEPINSLLLTCAIAFFFIAIGDIDFVAQIISMFFMVTYGAICTISFLEHFAADPAYRPTFKSKWYFSGGGAILSFGLMFAMNFNYAILSIAIMVGIYFWVATKNTDKPGIEKLFKGVIFQLSRELQVYLQKRDKGIDDTNWRPFIICFSQDSFKRRSAFDMIRWMSNKYGFGTYIHYTEGFLSKETFDSSANARNRLIELAEGVKSRVYIDTLISPSYTSAIAQVIQLSGVSGKGNNMMLFEYLNSDPKTIQDVIDNYGLLRTTEFDVCILRSTYKGFGYKKEIHIWISHKDYENSNLMILLAYIMMGHPEWKHATIKIFSIYENDQEDIQREKLLSLIQSGRLPISQNNIELIPTVKGGDIKSTINIKSGDADLTVLGYDNNSLADQGIELFEGYEDIGNILFVSAFKEKEIDLL